MSDLPEETFEIEISAVEIRASQITGDIAASPWCPRSRREYDAGPHATATSIVAAIKALAKYDTQTTARVFEWWGFYPDLSDKYVMAVPRDWSRGSRQSSSSASTK